MSYKRLVTLLAIKEPLTPEQRKAWSTALVALKKLKSYASKINEGSSNEEMTIKATWHICRHDEGKPCDSVQEI